MSNNGALILTGVLVMAFAIPGVLVGMRINSGKSASLRMRTEDAPNATTGKETVSLEFRPIGPGIRRAAWIVWTLLFVTVGAQLLVAVVNSGWSTTTEILTGSFLVGVMPFAMVWLLFRTSIAIRDGTLAARAIAQKDLTVPLDAIKRVVRTPRRGGQRSVYYLLNREDRIVATVLTKAHRQAGVAPLLALMPPVEDKETNKPRFKFAAGASLWQIAVCLVAVGSAVVGAYLVYLAGQSGQ